MQLKLNKSTIDIISRECCLSGIIQTQVMRVQKTTKRLESRFGLAGALLSPQIYYSCRVHKQIIVITSHPS